MKKLFILFLFAAVAAGASAQVIFKNAIKPNTTYTTNREMTMVMNMTPPEALAAMAGGQGLTMNMMLNSTTILTTMSKDGSGQIPLTFTSKIGTNKITMNGQELPSTMIPADDANMTCTGKYDGRKIIVESISGKTMDDSLRTMMNKIIENAMNTTKFPDHALKVGDSFTSDAPFALPLPGMSQKSAMDVKSTYKLVSLNNGVGVFDLTFGINADVNQAAAGQDVGVKVSGSGTGTMTFDSKKEFYTAMNMKMAIDFGINTGGMDMKGKGDLTINDKVDIASK